MTGHDPEVTLAELMLFLSRLTDIGAQGEDWFAADWTLQEAATSLTTKAAEVASRLPDEVKGQYGGVPWEQLKGIRNRLLRGYQATDLSVVWRVWNRDAASTLEALAVDPLPCSGCRLYGARSATRCLGTPSTRDGPPGLSGGPSLGKSPGCTT